MFEGCGLEKVGERSDRLPTLPNPNTEILNTLIRKKSQGGWISFEDLLIGNYD